MKSFLLGPLASIVVLAVAGEVFADPIIVVTADHRVTSAVAVSSSPTVSRASDVLVATATSPGGPGSGLSTAALTSSFTDPMHWLGTGTATISRPSGPGPFGAGSGYDFDLDFTVTSPVSYTFDSSFTASRSVPFGCCSASNPLALLFRDTGRDEDGEINSEPLVNFTDGVQISGGNGAASRSFTGLLAPGKYAFMIDGGVASTSSGTGTASSGMHFAFDFAPADAAPTPEPASLLLLGTGLAGLLRYRRRSALS